MSFPLATNIVKGIVPSDAWTPYNEASLYHWVDAADPSLFTLAGSDISVLTNKGSSGITYTQPSASNRPVYVSTAGSQALQFTAASGDHLPGSAALAIGTVEHMVAMVLTTDAPADARVWNNTDASGSRNFVDIDSTGPKVGYMCSSSFFQPAGTAFTANNRFIFIGRYNGSNANFGSVNGGSETVEGSGSDLAAVAHTLGARVTTNDNYNGSIHEWLIFTSYSTALRDNVLNYLSGKWGVAI